MCVCARAMGLRLEFGQATKGGLYGARTVVPYKLNDRFDMRGSARNVNLKVRTSSCSMR